MTKTAVKRSILPALLALVLVFLSAITFNVRAEDAAGAEPVFSCAYACSTGARNLSAALGDGEYRTYVILKENAWISVTWEGEVDFVYWEWTDIIGIIPAPYTVELLDAAGGTVDAFEGERYWNSGVAVTEGVAGVRITMQATGRICTLLPYAGGAPADYHPWQPTPDKTDFLIIATHPDDDTVFMGAILPTYGAERGLSGSVLYMTSQWRVRRTEALNGAWTMGLRTYPLFAGMADVPNDQQEELEDEFKLNDVVRKIVRYIRQVKPEVVITHDINGEYGHWQHKVVAKAARIAVVRAADPSYDKRSYEFYGAWQVKKLYLHLYRKNAITVSAMTPLDSFGGLTAWEVAQRAYECHRSQNRENHPCNNRNENSLERFGLAFTTVGYDAGLNDMFENIDEALLTNYIQPTAVPEPTEEPAPEATEATTPEPTAEPTEGPTAEPTKVPEPTAAPTAAPVEAPITPMQKLMKNGLAVAAGTALIVLIPLAALLIANRVKKK
ncbi:MAG: PIG-L family deacetylase [Clostridia bacterium]|nr:PIG-L family deacetylase [Clostridia bacterium]